MFCVLNDFAEWFCYVLFVVIMFTLELWVSSVLLCVVLWILRAVCLSCWCEWWVVMCWLDVVLLML